MSAVAARLADVRARVDRACRRAGREAARVTVVAVSKKQPLARVEAALAAGHLDFGENYAQELAARADALGNSSAVRWHFIGRLQRNKVKLVVGRAVLIHAVDSERLIRAIDREAGHREIVQPFLIAVNLAGETQKSGVVEDAVEPLLEVVAGLESVRCDGLMAMPPLPEVPEDSRPHFAALRELRDRLASADRPLAELSIGTTADYEVAVEEGATLVRVGTEIFGPRAT